MECLRKQLHNWRVANKDFSGGFCGIDDNKEFIFKGICLFGEDLELSIDDAVEVHCALTKHLKKWGRL